MARSFKELETRMSAESIATSDSLHRRLKETIVLEELRGALLMTQRELAQSLNVDQSAVATIEQRADIYVSTLRRCIASMGGQLEIHAVFPEGSVPITRFEQLSSKD